MHSINNKYGVFSLEFETGNNKGLLTIHPEMGQAKIGIRPTGRYFIYCVHPERGSGSFILEQDMNTIWVSERHPPFIEPGLIPWIGQQIEEHKELHGL
jgi:hypothetical protein